MQPMVMVVICANDKTYLVTWLSVMVLLCHNVVMGLHDITIVVVVVVIVVLWQRKTKQMKVQLETDTPTHYRTNLVRLGKEERGGGGRGGRRDLRDGDVGLGTW